MRLRQLPLHPPAKVDPTSRWQLDTGDRDLALIMESGSVIPSIEWLSLR